MKINLIKCLGISATTLMLFAALNSCVKNRNETATDFTQIQPVVELLVSPPLSSTPSKIRTVSYDTTVVNAQETIYVNYAGPGPAPRDIVITLAISPTTIPSGFLFFPTTAYSFSTQATIKQGQYFVPVVLNFKPRIFDISLSYGFSVSIVDAQGVIISANYHTQTYLVVGNPYQGAYTTTGWFFHPTSGRAISAIYNISAVSGTRERAPVGDLGGAGFLFDFDVINNVATNWSATGSTPGPTGSGSGSSGFMSADNPGGTDYSNPSNGGNVPGVGQWKSSIYNNTYDLATKTFYLHYGYVATVIGGQSAYTRQIYVKMVKN